MSRMRTKEEAEQRRAARCRHFTGVQNDKCEADIMYKPGSPPCCGDHECDTYSPLTKSELEEKEKDAQRFLYLLKQGLSGCCEAPFDTSKVIPSGPHKNHGPRFCSKCGKLAFIV